MIGKKIYGVMMLGLGFASGKVMEDKTVSQLKGVATPSKTTTLLKSNMVVPEPLIVSPRAEPSTNKKV